MARFLYLKTLKEGLLCELSAQESSHIARVLRLEEGSQICLSDGKGTVADALIEKCTPSCVVVRIQKVRKELSTLAITVAFGIPKGPAMEFLLRRVTEIGVSAFQPLRTKHSLHPETFNTKRWEKILAEVTKQNELSQIPRIYPVQSLSQWLSNRETSATLIYCDENQRMAPLPEFTKEPLDLLIGPEGGWHREEIAQFISLKAVPMGLGELRLRMETAALVATTLLKKALKEFP